MNYRYKTMKEIVAAYDEEGLIIALENLDVEVEEGASLAELRERLLEAQKSYLSEMFYMLSEVDLRMLLKMKAQEGNFYVGPMEDEVTDDYLNVLETFERLFDLAIVYPDLEEMPDGGLEACVSEEFLTLFEDYLQPERLGFSGYLDDAAKIIQGALYYYGAISLEKLFELVHTNHGNMDFTFFNRVLSYKMILHHRYVSVDVGEEEYILAADYEDFFDPSAIKAKEKRYGYRPLSKEELLDASAEDFIEELASFEQLFDYFKNCELMDDQTRELFHQVPEEILFDVFLSFTLELSRKVEDPTEVVNAFFASVEISGEMILQEAKKLLMDHMNSLSRWAYLGYSEDQRPNKRLSTKNVVSMKAYLQKKDPS